MKPASRKRITEWVIDVWFQLSKENIIKLFKCCGLNLANNGTEDDFIHCLKKGQPCKAGRQKLNSQLAILVDENDVVNQFIFHAAAEDANEEMNLIEDETDEEIMVRQKRLGYSYTIRYYIDIEKIPTILCESRSNNRFARYCGNSRNCLNILD